MSLRHIELKSPHPHGFKADSSDPPTADLRDYLTRKSSVHQVTSQCCCEWLIMIVLSECHCSSHASRPSVFNRLSAVSVSDSSKRRCFRKKKSFSDEEYPEATSNMVGSGSTPCRSRGKQLEVSSKESDADRSPG